MKETFPVLIIFAWVAAIFLTAGTIFTGNLMTQNSLPLGEVRLAIIVVVTTLKSFLVLHYYLNFRLAPKNWQKASYIFVFLLLACVAAFFYPS